MQVLLTLTWVQRVTAPTITASQINWIAWLSQLTIFTILETFWLEVVISSTVCVRVQISKMLLMLAEISLEQMVLQVRVVVNHKQCRVSQDLARKLWKLIRMELYSHRHIHPVRYSTRIALEDLDRITGTVAAWQWCNKAHMTTHFPW